MSPARQQALTWLGLALGLGLLIWLLAPVVAPFAGAWVLAYALEPAVRRLTQSTRMPRVLAIVVVLLGALLLVLAALLLVAPILWQQLPLLRDQLPDLLTRLYDTVAPRLEQLGVRIPHDFADFRALVIKALGTNSQSWIASVLNSARIGGSVALTTLGWMTLVPIAAFYLLLDWDSIVARMARLVPPRLLPGFSGFLQECDHLLGQYLRGQLLVMLILAVLYSVGLALFGFDLAVPVGVFTGLAVFIPYVGFGLGLVLALLAGVLQFGPHGQLIYALTGVAVVYGLGQIVESFFLTPFLVGDRIGLHPIAVIFALLAFGQLFGFVGVLLALPLSAVSLVALRRLVAVYQLSRLYTG